MPRIALVVLCVLGGCSFEANYAGGVYLCSDGICPSGLVCEINLDGDYVCREPRKDAAVDVPGDGVPFDSAPAHAFNCFDPEPLPMNGATVMGSTKGRSNKVAPQCFNAFMNGADAVYSITPGAGRQLHVSISAAHVATAYVITPCPANACMGNIYAYENNAMTVTTVAGTLYVVVDSTLAAAAGEYTLTVSF
jgi:hypothetical protein